MGMGIRRRLDETHGRIDDGGDEIIRIQEHKDGDQEGGFLLGSVQDRQGFGTERDMISLVPRTGISGNGHDLSGSMDEDVDDESEMVDIETIEVASGGGGFIQDESTVNKAETVKDMDAMSEGGGGFVVDHLMPTEEEPLQEEYDSDDDVQEI